MSPLFTRRAAHRASLRESSTSSDISLPSPHLTPLLPGAVLPNNALANFPWHNPHAHSPPPTSPPPPSWPPCPIENHTTCPHGAVYHYANTYPGRQQRALLAHGGFGADFFEYGNPPPAVWAAVWRVLGGRIEKRDLDLVFEYRINHCPRRRGEIVEATRGGWEEEEEEEEEGALRGRMEGLGIGDGEGEGEMARMDGVVRGGMDWVTGG